MITAYKRCFCEKSFLEKFESVFPNNLKLEESPFDSNYRDFWDFIKKRAEIGFDISQEEFKNIANSYNEQNCTHAMFHFIQKRYSGGAMKLSFDEKLPISNSTNNEVRNRNSVYLLSKTDEECSTLSNKFGTIVLNCDLVGISDQLFKDNGIALPSQEYQDWSFLKKRCPNINCCNSLILVDNYLFLNTPSRSWQKKVDCNLKPILNIILPEKNLEWPFELYIFTTAEENSNPTIWAKEKYDYLSTTINKIRKDLTSIKICFFTCSSYEAIHDRSIITNNVEVISEKGFDIFRNNKTAKVDTTTINVVFPLIQKFSEPFNERFIKVLKFAKKIMDETSDKSPNYVGNPDRSNSMVKFYLNDKPSQVSLDSLQVGDKLDLAQLNRR